MTEPPADSFRWPHRLALALAGVTWVMIVWGALVTTTGSGDAVPDWPLSFGQVLPPMVGGVFYEHGHRMIGWTVGLLAIITAASLWSKSQRRWLRTLSIITLAGIVCQGLLGGLRVLVVSDPRIQDIVLWILGAGDDVSVVRLPIAIIHAVSAQAVFCLAAVLALTTSVRWGTPRQLSLQGGTVRGICLTTVILLFVQTGFGAYLRHVQPAPFAIPAIVHACGALALTVLAILLYKRISSGAVKGSCLHQAVMAMLVLTLAQIVLGLAAWSVTLWTWADMVHATIVTALRSCHVAVGTLVSGAAVVVTVESYRMPVAESSAESVAPTLGRVVQA